MLNLVEQLKQHDLDTYLHSYRVAELSLRISQACEHSKMEQQMVYYGGLLHDIGKLKINTEILSKPGKLTNEEWSLIQQHTVYGFEILRSDFKAQTEILYTVLFHHERMNGLGYPFGINGEHIPVQAQIVAIADSFDAMTNHRSYSKAKTTMEAIEILQADEGYSRLLLDKLVDLYK
ncbi:HD-GYP domain-containing protein [Ammoniphilus sp. CFH 90114]|uniref:HD-GYP domain-containing protein n=1 Tax=Ammoniphilus sp. CFH 90114 TaxID=2493665 RepID=UPI00100E5A74|nr:HD domain-containing phosphohydrolase [Ammoniphilus sp. CFH 90114]RXT03796.1 HD domain-containing protein [Ammoniphilus sp. CFH 90114]